MMTRLEAFSNLNMEEVNKDDNSDEDWKEVFDRLDDKDGVTDGRIDKWAFLEWMDTLDFQTTVSFLLFLLSLLLASILEIR